MLIERYLKVKSNIEEAENNSAYNKKVTLVAVSKTHPASAVQTVYDAGQRDFGENKVQELVEKYEQLPKDIRWHMIGHLQTNKVKYIIDKVCLIHSVDSVKLALTIDKEAAKKNLCMPVLIEINLGREENKSGVLPEELYDLLVQIASLKHIKVKGFMCIPPVSDNAEETRYYFRALRNLSIDIKQRNIDNIETDILSMGMSNDYREAISEGSDIVRVGTSIFGIREYMKQ